VTLTVIDKPDLVGSLALREARVPEPELSRTNPTPAAAFHAARRMFLEGKRLDMQALAADLGVSRATLYRWTGHREQLLADVLWSLSDDSFERAKEDHPEHTGRERLLAIFRQHVGVLVRARPLQTFLQQETHAALRILTSTNGGVQPRTVWKLAQLYREEQQAGAFQPCTDPAILAYAVVRVTEGFIYNDAILAIEPEVERAASIVSLMLQENQVESGLDSRGDRAVAGAS
jgi:AcrR family transcriptional regulator